MSSAAIRAAALSLRMLTGMRPPLGVGRSVLESRLLIARRSISRSPLGVIRALYALVKQWRLKLGMETPGVVVKSVAAAEPA